jgi:hypothetical protein
MLGERMPRDLSGQAATIVGWALVRQKLGSWLQTLGMPVVALRQHAQAKPDAGGEAKVTFKDWHQDGSCPRSWSRLTQPVTPVARKAERAPFF